jgi:hypothetical protein
MYWWTYYSDAGLIGTTAQIGLPVTEKVLTVADGIVVSARHHPDLFGDSEALVIRDFATGALIREIAVSMDWPHAEVIDGRLFWTGMAWGQNDESPFDAGVWTARIDGNDQPQAIVEPGKVIGSQLSGRRLELSPSKRTMAAITTSLGGDEWTDIIDVQARTRTTRIRDVSINTLTDDLYFVDEEPTTDAPHTGHGITARDLVTGAVRWRYPDPADEDRFGSNDMRAFGSIVVVDYSWETGNDVEKIIGTFDAATGERRILLRQTWSGTEDPLAVDFSVSTPEHLLLASVYRIGFVIEDGSVPISVLDVVSGSLERNAFVIDPPWYCNDEHCFRD